MKMERRLIFTSILTGQLTICNSNPLIIQIKFPSVVNGSEGIKKSFLCYRPSDDLIPLCIKCGKVLSDFWLVSLASNCSL